MILFTKENRKQSGMGNVGWFCLQGKRFQKSKVVNFVSLSKKSLNCV